MALIDEIIEIDIDLASLSQSPLVHRTFVCFLKLTGDDKSIKITQSNLDESLELIDETHKEVVKIWFKSGGSSLRVYSNELGQVAEIEEIEEHNIIFAGNSAQEQLAIYNALSNTITEPEEPEEENPEEGAVTTQSNITSKATKTVLLGKYLYFSVDTNFNESSYPKGRGIHGLLTNADDISLEVFEYLAPYTQVDYYRKNNFESSNLQGLSLKTLSFLTSNNLGCLVYFPELSESKYYNIVDLAGFGLNRNFLVKDLEYKIKNRCFTALTNSNSYSDGTLAKIDNIIASCADFYVGITKIESYKTYYLPKLKQQQEDVINGIAKGFKIAYKPVDEMKKLQINLQEEL